MVGTILCYFLGLVCVASHQSTQTEYQWGVELERAWITPLIGGTMHWHSRRAFLCLAEPPLILEQCSVRQDNKIIDEVGLRWYSTLAKHRNSSQARKVEWENCPWYSRSSQTDPPWHLVLLCIKCLGNISEKKFKIVATFKIVGKFEFSFFLSKWQIIALGGVYY